MDSPRILVVEDDPTNLLVITHMLRRLGHEADIAHNGVEAVAAAERVDYDIIFMDLMMPELDGIQAARQSRGQPAGKGPTIFAVTANVMPEDRAAALEAGMNDYVTKPIRLETIRELVTTGSQQESATADFIDVQTFEELREMMGDADFFSQLVKEFVQNSDELVGEMEAALATSDWTAISRAAHSLKSTSASFGGTTLTRCNELVEDAVRRDATGKVRGLVAEIKRERDRLCARILASV